MHENEISYIARGTIFKIYNTLGPGLLESVYETILAYELTKAGLEVRTQVPLPVFYEEVKLNVGFRLDLLVQNKVIIEVKSVVDLNDFHHKQILTYLKLSGYKLGLLVNFSCCDIGRNIFRKVNGI